MEKLLKPETFEALPDSESSSQRWTHWKIRFNKFVQKCKDATDEDKLDLLINLISPFIYPYITDCADLTEALKTLDGIYNPTKSVIFARHKLITSKQESSETIDVYFQRLKSLARECNYAAVNKITHESEAIREAFVAGITSSNIRQRLLETENTDLDHIYNLARSLEVAKVQAETYSKNFQQFPVNAVHHDYVRSTDSSNFDVNDIAAALPQSSSSNWRCYNCGDTTYHRKSNCKAKKEFCGNCGRKGHLSVVCKSPPQDKARGSSKQAQVSALHYLAASPPSLSKSIHKVMVNGVQLDALFDSGSSASFVDEKNSQAECMDL